MGLFTRRKTGSLTASAVRVGDTRSEYAKRKKMPWQTRALEYIDLIPELSAWSLFYARMLKQVRFFPAFVKEDDTLDPITEGPPADLLDRIKDPGGGISEIMSAYGRLMATTGEGCLFGRNLDTEFERWSFVWNDELDVEEQPNGVVRKIRHKADNNREYGPDQAVVYRMWTPHPRNTGEADSPMRSVLQIAEELLGLTDAVQATIKARITNGVILLPEELSPPPIEPVGDEDPMNDPLLSDIADAFEAQVENPGAAAARVPPVVRGQFDYLAGIRHLTLHDPQTDYMERDLRKEAVDRLAIGLDAPPEAIKGIGQTNHWAAMQIIAQMWQSHGFPKALQFAQQLADVYLRPALREGDDEHPKFERWSEVVIGIDSSQVTVKPDRSDDAKQAAMLRAIGPRGTRKLMNIPEDLAPTPDEIEYMKLFFGRQQGGFGGDPSTNGNAPAENGPPLPGPEGDSGRRTRIVSSIDTELGAAQMALLNCRKLAGLRIRNKSMWAALEKDCAECAENATTLPHELVASTIGAEPLIRIGANPVELVKGGTDTFWPFLLSQGYSETQAASLCEMVETYAARTLCEERIPPLPSGFTAQLEAMKEMHEDAIQTV